jgi:type IV pilus assembly protein PilB
VNHERNRYFQAKEIDLATVDFTPDLLRCIPKLLALKYRVLPISELGDCLCIALADPSDLDTIDTLHHVLKREVELRIADEQQIDMFLHRLYGANDGGND